jgi:cysteinyl-tRNA synthetase
MSHAQRFRDALNDDFNTPEAIAVLFELATAVHRHASSEAPYYACQLHYLAGILGLLQRPAQDFLQYAGHVNSTLSEDIILEKIAARSAAKQAKDYTLADHIRSDLLAAGITLEDKPNGLTEWRRN